MMVDDKRIEAWVGHILQGGVMLAALLVFTGGALLIAHHDQNGPSGYAQFHGQPARFTGVAEILDGARNLDPESLIMLGLLVLIATPVVRVVVCLAGFGLQGDGMYVGISATVLAILLYSLLFHR